MRKHATISIILLVLFGLLGWYFLINQRGGETRFPFRFGLDLVGGTELVYRADTTQVDDVDGVMESLKGVIERRIAQANLSGALGTLEPLIQTESAGIISGNRDERLIVELPGVTDVEKAKALIGKTPTLEFWLLKRNVQEIIDANPQPTIEDLYTPTEITGKYLTRASVVFGQTGTPAIALNFNKEGGVLFAKLTKEHKGESLAIFLDGTRIQEAVIQDEITNGEAQITGSFTPEYAKASVKDLNYGALPVPIEFHSSQTIGATLGDATLDAGVRAGVIGFVVLSIFLVLWYRLPGLIAVIALISYTILSLAIFKLIPVTLTAAGMAGFVLSLGMAVDANILIFERTKEEMKKGKNIHDSLHEGFLRAWLSIRDSNISSIITAIVLFWLGTSAVKGFALTLGVGVMVSMFSAITLSRTFLFAACPEPVEGASAKEGKISRFLFSNGFHK
ncbi:MAG: protein translocase subunit SecD [Candidatus Zambryskibacteria bacterium]|nr:protein translocase subunit SecD [Candidatus Zambryskibacteria bacterium]